MKKNELVRVRAVQPLHDFWVHVTFTNGVERDIDLEPEIWGPVFEPLRNNPELFRQVYVDPLSRTLAWPGELDLDPDTLYYGDNPPWLASRAKTKTSSKRTPRNEAATRKSIQRVPKRKKTWRKSPVATTMRVKQK